MTETTELYRHFDASGRLLYVGVSLSVLHRLRKHRQSSEWFGEIVTITIARFETRAAALAAEKAAVQTERPRFNVALTGTRITHVEVEPLAVRLRRRREKRSTELGAA
jgi:excinuclease UvrABC nuclease subunit